MDVLTLRRVVTTLSVTVAAVGVAAAVGHYLREPYNPGFLEWPLIVAAHVIPGTVFLALAPLQFFTGPRRRLAYHRPAGRLIVAAGFVAGAAGIFMSLTIPFSGLAERVLVTPFFGWFVYALWMGLDHARAGRVVPHRAWMIRAFAIASSIATMRIIFIPAVILAGEPELETIRTLSISSFFASFVIHIAVSEWWIRRTSPAPDGAQPEVARTIMDAA